MMKEFEMMREKIRKQGSRAMSSNSSILAPPARPFPKQLQSQFVSEQSRKSVEAKEQGNWKMEYFLSKTEAKNFPCSQAHLHGPRGVWAFFIFNSNALFRCHLVNMIVSMRINHSI